MKSNPTFSIVYSSQVNLSVNKQPLSDVEKEIIIPLMKFNRAYNSKVRPRRTKRILHVQV